MEEYGTVLQNQPVDVSREFARQDNHFVIGSKVSEFAPPKACSVSLMMAHCIPCAWSAKGTVLC
jgi:hypothetical protein